MPAEIRYSFDPVSAIQLQRLFGQTTWAKNRSVEAIELMLQNTSLVIGAWSEERLIGFARAYGDMIFRAAIDDVVVESSFRGRGIGGLLVGKLLERLDGVDEVSLGCSEEVVPFYARLGFSRATHPYMKRRGG